MADNIRPFPGRGSHLPAALDARLEGIADDIASIARALLLDKAEVLPSMRRDPRGMASALLDDAEALRAEAGRLRAAAGGPGRARS